MYLDKVCRDDPSFDNRVFVKVPSETSALPWLCLGLALLLPLVLRTYPHREVGLREQTRLGKLVFVSCPLVAVLSILACYVRPG